MSRGKWILTGGEAWPTQQVDSAHVAGGLRFGDLILREVAEHVEDAFGRYSHQVG